MVQPFQLSLMWASVVALQPFQLSLTCACVFPCVYLRMGEVIHMNVGMDGCKSADPTPHPGCRLHSWKETSYLVSCGLSTIFKSMCDYEYWPLWCTEHSPRTRPRAGPITHIFSLDPLSDLASWGVAITLPFHR